MLDHNPKIITDYLADLRNLNELESYKILNQFETIIYE